MPIRRGTAPPDMCLGLPLAKDKLLSPTYPFLYVNTTDELNLSVYYLIIYTSLVQLTPFFPSCE